MLEDSLRALNGDNPKPNPPLAMPYITAAEWRLASDDARAADSLAALVRAAATVDSLALVRARARRELGDRISARAAADRAAAAMTNGFGVANRLTREARAPRDSLAGL